MMCVNGYSPVSLWSSLLCKNRNRHIFLEEWLKPKEGIKCPSGSILLRAKVPVRTFFSPQTDFWQMESIVSEDIHIGF